MRHRLFATAMALVCCSPLIAQAPPSLADALWRAGQSSLGLQEQLGVLIADEKYVQDQWSRPLIGRPSGTGRIRRRTMTSEMLFLQLSRLDVWVAVRNVLTVDGRTVPDNKDRFDRLLSEPGSLYLTRLRQIDAASARYDIGNVWRTTGYPTIALRFLLPSYQPRFAFAEAGQERIAGEMFMRLTFAERGSPTVIQVKDSEIASKGTVWLRPSDGAVARTTLDLTSPAGVDISITTDFSRDPRLGAWVPARMHERYTERSGASTTGSAEYSNFRRFETSGRLVVQ